LVGGNTPLATAATAGYAATVFTGRVSVNEEPAASTAPEATGVARVAPEGLGMVDEPGASVEEHPASARIAVSAAARPTALTVQPYAGMT
jgi:hypothetical protein